jgi:hypothetical protein
MDCRTYKELTPRFSRLPLDKSVWDTPEYEEWVGHFHECRGCGDRHMAQEVEGRGHDVKEYPCVHLAYYVTYQCDEHEDLSQCSRVPITYDPRFDEYFATREGNTWHIRYCPWCGIELPESKRDLWFDRLEALGFDNPAEQEIPQEYMTAAWYKEG